MLSRESLLASVLTHVEAHGLGELSLRALAAQVGTSHRMLSYHFGSRDGLLLAVVDAVEQRQRERLAALLAESDADPVEQARAFTAQLLDPALWPAERLFFELYAQALQGRAPTTTFLDGVVDEWLEPVGALLVRLGVPAAEASTHARLALAVTRGLLLDLLATGDVAGVRAAAELHLAAYVSPSAGSGAPVPNTPPSRPRA